MQKIFGRPVIHLFMLIFLSSSPGHCAEQDPVKFLTDFYTWYISAHRQMQAVYHRDIYDYVVRETVQEIKKRPEMPGHDRTDYFIKLDNTPSDINNVSILVNQVETIGPDTLVATVTIVNINKDGYRFPDGVIIVVLRRIQGNLKILKCIDTYPEG